MATAIRVIAGAREEKHASQSLPAPAIAAVSQWLESLSELKHDQSPSL
ncbi:MAG: hypothetical protein ACFB12_03870 [Leptolyngbyaceae cyanobacterium]